MKAASLSQIKASPLLRTKVQNIAKYLFLAVKDKDSKQQQKIVRKLVDFLKEENKVGLLPLILEEFIKYSKEREVKLILARDFDSSTVNEIKKELRKTLGEDRFFKVEKEPAILGGFLARGENYLIDASVKGFVERAEKKMLY